MKRRVVAVFIITLHSLCYPCWPWSSQKYKVQPITPIQQGLPPTPTQAPQSPQHESSYSDNSKILQDVRSAILEAKIEKALLLYDQLHNNEDRVDFFLCFFTHVKQIPTLNARTMRLLYNVIYKQLKNEPNWDRIISTMSEEWRNYFNDHQLLLAKKIITMMRN